MSPPSRAVWPLLLVLLALAIAHALSMARSEPFFNNDEGRHVMTGVFVRDLLHDRPPVGDLRAYAERYYLQYPALGLLIWPPAFYGFEGVWMLVVGDCFLGARILVGLFALLALVYAYRLFLATHGQRTAVTATLFLGSAPLVFGYSSRVMLEVPAFAWFLMSAFHFHRYLERERRRDLALCCLAMALTALTRFDAIFLAPFFLIWLLARRRGRVLLRPSVWLGLAGAALLVAPVWWLTCHYYGAAHLKAIREGTGASSSGLLLTEHLAYYPLCVPDQIGWALLVPLVIGLVLAVRRENRAVSLPYLCLLAAVYITFSPMAELEPRHAIYWIPALVVFAAEGCAWIVQRIGTRWYPAFVGVLVSGVGVQTFLDHDYYVRGYEQAARYVLAHNTQTPVCLFDSFLNADFIYQVRRHDPERRLSVLRGDKLFFSVHSDPHSAYEEYATSQEDVLKLLYRFDPELIVIEEPQVHFDLPAGRLLRETLRGHPERFERVKVIPIESNHPLFKGVKLHIYRSLKRNPSRENLESIRVLGIGGAVGVSP